MEKTTEQVLTALLGLVVVALYIAMVVDGVRVARRKGRSPHWMWFGLHPAGGLIVWIYFRCASVLRRCPRCSGGVKMWAAMCHRCGYVFAEATPAEKGTIRSVTGTSPELVTQQILELKRMLDLGLITQPEFEEKKKQVLSKM